MSQKGRSLPERMGFALAGLRAAWQRERSFRTHCLAAIVAFAALLIIRPAAIWWAIVMLVVALVVALELANSAIEGVIDLLHPGIHPEIKAIKDMMAGAVLIASIAALGIAAALMWEKGLPMLGLGS